MRFFSLLTSGKTKKIFVIALFFSVAIVGAYCYLWVEIIQKNQNIGILLGEAEALNLEKEIFSSVKEKVAETMPMREKLTEFFIPKDGVVSFLNTVQTLGAGNKLEFKVGSVAIEDEAGVPDSFENVKLNVDAEGTWDDLYRFATLAELMPFKVSVDQIDLEIVPKEISNTSKKTVTPAIQRWTGKISLRVLKLK